MSDKRSSRDRHPQPPPFCPIYKTQRSVSIDNELKREPITQSVRRRNCKLYMTLNGRSTSRPIERRSNVAELIRKIEEFDSTNKNLVNTNNSLPVTKHTPVLTSFNRIFTSKRQQEKITSTTPLVNQCPSSVELRIETTIHHTTEPISTDQLSKDSLEQTIVNTDQSNDHRVEIADLFVRSTQHESLLSEEYVTPPSSDAINKLSGDFSTSRTSDDDDLSDGSSVDGNKDFTANKKTSTFKGLQEVYQTERAYVEKLRVLSYLVTAQIKETCQKDKQLIRRFKIMYKPLQSALKRLYKFHMELILPYMEQYQTDQPPDTIWSIVEDHFQTIEKLYKDYYISYDEQQDRLEKLCKQSSLIDRAMLECQVHLGNLYPIAQLNCANQHLLRYILLMENHIKHLCKTSPEYERICYIRDELSQIARRCGDELAVSPTQLKRLKARFDNKPDCFENQQLIWHGLLKRRSPRRRISIIQSYMILFSDCILVCEDSGDRLELKRQLSIKNITTDAIEGGQPALGALDSINKKQWNVVTYPFRVNAIEKSYEFLVDNEQNRQKWISKIRQASEEFARRGSNVEVRQSSHHSNKQEFGTRAAAWVNDIDVTRCQICHNRFGSTLIRSRHHCRSCGRCICNPCSTKRLILTFCNDEGEVRVCDTCYTHFTGIAKSSIPSTRTLRNPDRTILFGNFYCTSSHTFVWLDLQDDHHLHIYGARLDQVEEFSIHLIELRELSFNKETRTFILNMKDKIYKFTIRLNHQIMFQENDYINESVKQTMNKSLFYANLWHDTMQLARSKSVPLWYTRKRHSADSGILTA